MTLQYSQSWSNGAPIFFFRDEQKDKVVRISRKKAIELHLQGKFYFPDNVVQWLLDKGELNQL